MRRRSRPAVIAGTVVAVVLSACGPTRTLPIAATVPDAEMRLDVQNGTTLALQLVVNDARPIPLAPGALLDLPSTALPTLPWHAVVRFPTGRSLVELTVRSGDVMSGPTSSIGDAARVDLSCGRIDLWSGPPLAGPAPHPSSGAAGDCAP